MENIPVEGIVTTDDLIKTKEGKKSILFWPSNRDMPAQIGHGLESIARYIEECVPHLFHGFVINELRSGAVKIEETGNLTDYKQYIIKASNDFIIGYTNICPVDKISFIDEANGEDESSVLVEIKPFCLHVDKDDVWQMASNPHTLDLWMTPEGRPVLYVNEDVEGGVKVIRGFTEIADKIWIPNFHFVEFLRDENYLGYLIETFKDSNAILYRTVEKLEPVTVES